MKIVIEVLGGRWDGKQFSLDTFPISIGRLPDNDVALPIDDFISRRHCTVFEDNGTLYISDLRSTNGTYLNEEKINQSTIIKTGDELLLGNTRLKINII